MPVVTRAFMDRRHVLFGSAAMMAASLRPASAAISSPPCVWPPADWVANKSFPGRRWVNIVFVPTGEHFHNIYMEDGQYIVPAIQQFSQVCRDYRENVWQMLNPYLLDFIFVMHWKYCREQIQVISGYRTRTDISNLERAILTEQHSRANAIDIRIPELDNLLVAADFARFIYGGVSIFPTLNFVHLDCGPSRNSVEHPDADSVSGQEEVKLTPNGGTYLVPALLNRTTQMKFVVDSGATDVLIPPEVLSPLVRSGTVDQADFIGSAVYVLADGSRIRSPRFFLREMIVGNAVIRNVQASVGPAGSHPLLGQSFLSKFDSWTINNGAHTLVLKLKS